MRKVLVLAGLLCLAPAAFAAQPISRPPTQHSMVVKICEKGCVTSCQRTQRKRLNVCQALCGC